MSDKSPTTRELWKLKQEYRKADPNDEEAQKRTWRAYQDAEQRANFLKGLAVYLSD